MVAKLLIPTANVKSALGDAVGCIVFFASQEQMVRVDAGLHVTAMHYDTAHRDLTVRELKRYSVGGDDAAPNPKLPVSVTAK